jgi:hypothetical protein
MKFSFGISPAIALVCAFALAPQPSLANCGHNGKDVGNGCAVGAPVPLIGAGLPGLAIGLGYGAYWLARRRRNQS